MLNTSSSAAAMTKIMYVGIRHAGEKWTEVFTSGAVTTSPVEVDPRGYAEFKIGPKSVSVWVDQGAEGRGQVDVINEQFV